MRTISLLFCCGVILLLACEKDQPANPQEGFPALMEVPPGFPPLPEPEDNGFTSARWELGKRLFYDPVMSVDSSISCASCHDPALAFTDGRAVSLGVENRMGRRNAPSLANVAYHPYFTREGGVPTLEMQILVPIQEHEEFDFNIVLLAKKLANDSTYVQMANEAYGRQPDPFVITRSLACFERSLLSGNSPYDQYLHQTTEQHTMTAAALRGMELFFSEQAKCSQCHGGFDFTDYRFANNGLYADYADPGRFRLTSNEADRAMFKVPGLRNVALTAPYMHDGSIATLEGVIAHYNSGGQEHPNKSELIRPLGLQADEVQDLVAFLESLTDESFIENPIFRKEE